MVLLPYLRSLRSLVSPHFRISNEPENLWTYRFGGPSIPFAGIERINMTRDVLGRREGNFVEAVEVNDDIELRAQGEQIIQDHQLLRLFVAVGGKVDHNNLFADRVDVTI